MVFLISASVLSTSNALKFSCTFQNYNWPNFGNAYSCNGAKVTIDNNSTVLESVTGSHISGKTNADVVALQVHYDATSQQQLPKSMEKFFPGSFIGGTGTCNRSPLMSFNLFPQWQSWI